MNLVVETIKVTVLLLLMCASIYIAYAVLSVITYFSGDLGSLQNMLYLMGVDNKELQLAFFLGIFFSLAFAILLKVGEHYGVVKFEK